MAKLSTPDPSAKEFSSLTENEMSQYGQTVTDIIETCYEYGVEDDVRAVLLKGLAEPTVRVWYTLSEPANA